MEGLPYFKFYAAEFLNDEDIRVMTFAERGLWLTLAARCWVEGSIPADLDRLARVLGERDAIALRSLYDGIAARFAPHPTDASRRISPRIEEERTKALEQGERRSSAGKKAAKARWKKEKSGDANRMRPHNGRSANGCHTDPEADTETEADTDTTTSGGGADLEGFRKKLASALEVPHVGLGKDSSRALGAIRRLLEAGIPEDAVVAECVGLARQKGVTPAHLSWWAGWLNTLSASAIARWRRELERSA